MKIERHNPGLTCFSDDVRMVPIKSIPGVVDAGWTPPTTLVTKNSRVKEGTTDIDVLAKRLKKVLEYVSILRECQRNTCFIILSQTLLNMNKTCSHKIVFYIYSVILK